MGWTVGSNDRIFHYDFDQVMPCKFIPLKYYQNTVPIKKIISLYSRNYQLHSITFMAKIVRKALPLEISIGLLLLIFGLSFLLAGQVFASNQPNGENVYFGMLLVSIAVIVMVLVLWEELLFPVKIKPEQNEVVFRNHRTKLKIQALIYCLIPAIFWFIYSNYALNHVRFYIWAAVLMVIPVVGKLISGINNYNDFLKLTDDAITYKNNRKTGTLAVTQLKHITLVKDERKILHKIELSLTDGSSVIIDLDEMELEAFLDTIEKYIAIHYGRLVN